VLVERFKRSGVSILGKTNTPEFGLQAIRSVRDTAAMLDAIQVGDVRAIALVAAI
jgi:hypothetical protein